MDPRTEQLTETVASETVLRIVTRSLWIAVRLIAVFYLGQSGERFFYQGF
jgi:hypothetical protein